MCSYICTVTVCLSLSIADGLRTIWVILWLPTEVSGSIIRSTCLLLLKSYRKPYHLHKSFISLLDSQSAKCGPLGRDLESNRLSSGCSYKLDLNFFIRERRTPTLRLWVRNSIKLAQIYFNCTTVYQCHSFTALTEAQTRLLKPVSFHSWPPAVSGAANGKAKGAEGGGRGRGGPLLCTDLPAESAEYNGQDQKPTLTPKERWKQTCQKPSYISGRIFRYMVQKMF